MQKPATIISYILIKIIGLFIIAGIILTFLFPKNDFTNIELHGKLLDAAGKPLAKNSLMIYSGISKGTYHNAQEARTNQNGLFQVAFQKKYTITMLKSFLKIEQMAGPPFYFGFKLSNDLNSSPVIADENYYIVKVTKDLATISTIQSTNRAYDKGKAFRNFRIATRIIREGSKWLIYAVIRES
jgi:hypothetical protein